MSVPTFSQLLSEHLLRSGISDAELARSIGVSRLTVHRWKEGKVTRPRSREDLLHCTKKLRLTVKECDSLLLAAGFAPETLSAEALRPSQEGTAPAIEQNGANSKVDETSPQPDEQTSAPEQSAVIGQRDQLVQSLAEIKTTTTKTGTTPLWFQQVAALTQSIRQLPNSRYIALGLVAIVLLLFQWLPRDPVPPPPPVFNTPSPSLSPIPTPGADETLLIVARFQGYTDNEQYNVAGRIKEALVKEIDDANLISITIAISPEEIDNPSSVQLEQLLVASGASLVIWGEYDSGRVRVNLTSKDGVTTPHDFLPPSPSELYIAILDVPKETRVLALTALGLLLRDQDDFE